MTDQTPIAGAAQARAEGLDALLDITHEEDGSWSVSIKAMPGHVGCADTLEQAYIEANDAAEAWVAASRAEGLDVEVLRLAITDSDVGLGGSFPEAREATDDIATRYRAILAARRDEG